MDHPIAYTGEGEAASQSEVVVREQASVLWKCRRLLRVGGRRKPGPGREKANGEVEVLGISPTNGPLDTRLAHRLYEQLDAVMQERDELLVRLEEGPGVLYVLRVLCYLLSPRHM